MCTSIIFGEWTRYTAAMDNREAHKTMWLSSRRATFSLQASVQVERNTNGNVCSVPICHYATPSGKGNTDGVEYNTARQPYAGNTVSVSVFACVTCCVDVLLAWPPKLIKRVGIGVAVHKRFAILHLASARVLVHAQLQLDVAPLPCKSAHPVHTCLTGNTLLDVCVDVLVHRIPLRGGLSDVLASSCTDERATTCTTRNGGVAHATTRTLHRM